MHVCYWLIRETVLCHYFVELLSFFSEVWPLSLLAFKAATQALSLPRKPVDTTRDVHNFKFPKLSADKRNFVRRDDSGKNDIKNGQYLSLDHCYRRHVKPKKQHEIKKLGEVLLIFCNYIKQTTGIKKN
jgi:hypothetical protein